LLNATIALFLLFNDSEFAPHWNNKIEVCTGMQLDRKRKTLR